MAANSTLPNRSPFTWLRGQRLLAADRKRMQMAKHAYSGGTFSGHPEEQLEEIELATQAWRQRQAAQRRSWRSSPAVVEHHRSRLAEEQALWARSQTPMPKAQETFLRRRIAEAEAGLL